MKVLVTGGCGFIGSHVVDFMIAKGHEVFVIDNFSTGRRENLDHQKNQVRIIEADISKTGDWQNEFKGVDWVAHLAALADIVPSIENPENYFHSNVTGTLNVLQASKAAKISHFVYAASSSCYGLADVYPTPETAQIKPEYPYALTKRLGEELVLHWVHVYKLPAISLRFFNVYGPRSRTNGTYGAMFGIFLAQKLAGKPYTIVGDGTQTRDFTYVTDIASAVFAALESQVPRGSIYNIGSSKTIAVNRIVEILGGPKVHVPKRPGEPDCTFADISKIQKELGWKPRVSVEEGIAEMLKTSEDWKKARVWDPESIAQATKSWFDLLGVK